MYTIFYNRKLSFLLIFLSFFLVSADLDFNTTASLRYKDIKVKYLDKTISANLNSPGVEVEKFSNGRLKRLTIHKINSVIEIHFYNVETGPEKPSLIQMYRVYNGLLLLDGQVVRLSEEGTLASENNWSKGKLHGRQILYNKDNNLVEEKFYDEGLPVKSWKLFYSNGNVASEISFPESKKTWEDTLVKNRNFDEPTNQVYAQTHFRHALQAKEIWYDLEGLKRKETVYTLFKTPDSFIATPNGENADFDHGGQVIGESNFYEGSGIKEQRFTSVGRVYQNRQTWFNDYLFKEQGYVILEGDSPVQE